MTRGEDERTSQAFQGALSDTLKDIKRENRKNPQVPCNKHPDTGQEDFLCLTFPAKQHHIPGAGLSPVGNTALRQQ